MCKMKSRPTTYGTLRRQVAWYVLLACLCDRFVWFYLKNKSRKNSDLMKFIFSILAVNGSAILCGRLIGHIMGLARRPVSPIYGLTT